MTLDHETYQELGWGESWPRVAGLAWDARAERLAEQCEYAARVRVTTRPIGAPCPGCGAAFNQRGGRGWLRTYCSDSCRVAHHQRLEREKSTARLAARPTHCGCCGTPIKQHAAGKVRRTCSTPC